MVEHTLHGTLRVVPAGEDEEGQEMKQLVLIAGPNAVYHIILHKKVADEVADEIGMTNETLGEKLMEEQRAAQARALLDPQNGGQQIPPELAAKLARQMRKQ